jgi:hypothetical protein
MHRLSPRHPALIVLRPALPISQQAAMLCFLRYGDYREWQSTRADILVPLCSALSPLSLTPCYGHQLDAETTTNSLQRPVLAVQIFLPIWRNHIKSRRYFSWAGSSAARAADSKSAERRDGRDANPNKPLILLQVSGSGMERENKFGNNSGTSRRVDLRP